MHLAAVQQCGGHGIINYMRTLDPHPGSRMHMADTSMSSLDPSSLCSCSSCRVTCCTCAIPQKSGSSAVASNQGVLRRPSSTPFTVVQPSVAHLCKALRIVQPRGCADARQRDLRIEPHSCKCDQAGQHAIQQTPHCRALGRGLHRATPDGACRSRQLMRSVRCWWSHTPLACIMAKRWRFSI